MKRNFFKQSAPFAATIALSASSLVALAPMAHAKTVKKSTHKMAPARRRLPGGLMVQDLKVGKGAVARAGQSVSVHYRGTLTNGKIFDESYKRHQPFDFTLGAGMVIAGWDQGVKGMKVGGKRKLIIPPALAYGAGGQGPIPPNATLIFEVELQKVS